MARDVSGEFIPIELSNGAVLDVQDGVPVLYNADRCPPVPDWFDPLEPDGLIPGVPHPTPEQFAEWVKGLTAWNEGRGPYPPDPMLPTN